MEKTKTLQLAHSARTTRRPARLADAEIDHLEHMILSLARSGDPKALAAFDRAYWQRRLAALGDESDLVSTQRARVLRLFDMLARECAGSTPKQAAA